MEQYINSQYKFFPHAYSHTVLYIEDSFNPEINHFIQSSFQLIFETFRSKGMNFIYLPFLLKNDIYRAIIHYNHPYWPPILDNISFVDIYRKMANKTNFPIAGSALVLLGSNDSDEIISFKEVNNITPIFSQFVDFSNDANYAISNDTWRDKSPSFRRVQMQRSIQDADDLFDIEAERLAEEIRERIRLLQERGALKLIGNIIEELQNSTIKLSKIFITNDYRIYLKDWDMREVIMPPLSKSLFFLFLRHPEGILFKNLSDYRDELLSIHRNISNRVDVDMAIESINAMTDPLNNSVNEKCSRIRAAFLEVISNDLAKNYYVTGYRGQPKKIILDRSLVEYQ